jgi:hypothetical protein
MRRAILRGKLPYDVQLIDAQTGANIFREVSIFELTISARRAPEVTLLLTILLDDVDLEGEPNFCLRPPGAAEPLVIQSVTFANGETWNPNETKDPR